MFLTTPTKVKEGGNQRSDAEIVALLDANGARSNSGTMVTSDTAMQQATVWACVRIIAETIAQLPITVQERQSNGQWVEVIEHDSMAVVADPNEWQTQHEFISHLITWSEMRGNGYYVKGRDSRGRVRQMLPLRADAVTVQQRRDWSLLYTVGESNGFSGFFDPAAIFHLRNFGSNGYMGFSTITNLRHSIGLALRTEEHGARLFQHGAQIGKVIKAPSATQPQIEKLQKDLRDKYEGALNAHRTMVLQGDMDISSVAMTQEDAQYLETRHFQKQEIASAYGVPLFILNDTKNSTSWGTGLEQQLRAFKTLSLQPRLCRTTQTMRRELLLKKERQRTRYLFETDALTMGDFKDRMAGYLTGIKGGVLNPNEARAKEGMNPRDGGDQYHQDLNTPTEEQASEQSQASDSPLETEEAVE